MWAAFCLLTAALPIHAIDGQTSRASIVAGVVTDAATNEPISDASVTLEGIDEVALTDSAGRFRVRSPTAGPQILVARRLGYAPTRMRLTAPASGELSLTVSMARHALRLPTLTVTADPSGRARGELGTASVVNRDAIATQPAMSVAGVLEFIPGVPLSPPGLGNVEQVGLRAAPTSAGGNTLGPDAGQLVSFGTLIVLNDVPLSNNSNLQGSGPRGELVFPSSAGGGVDLRRIPAATLERVEVIRGVPSARYGDLTQGAIVVDTRAGEVPTDLLARYDIRSGEAAIASGRAIGSRQLLSASADAASSKPNPLNDNRALRLALDVAHRWGPRAETLDDTSRSSLVLDSKLTAWQLLEDNPEDPAVAEGTANWSRDRGARISERARLKTSRGDVFSATIAFDRTVQRSYSQTLLSRGALPFTDRLTEGRSEGHFIGGLYLARVNLDGGPSLLYSRFEGDGRRAAFGLDHRIRAGAEFRREWNSGPGYQFDIEFPPQVGFNGVNGFYRPRRYDEIPPVASSSFYIDDHFTRTLPGDMTLDVQLGLRSDMLHRGTSWFSKTRDIVAQPRLNVQLAPRPWLRLRAAGGVTTKAPSLGSLFPAPQYFDVVNVNWYPPNPDERLAVLTTFIRDPSNPDLQLTRSKKVEAGFEVDLGSAAAITLTAFRDQLLKGVGFDQRTSFLIREHYALDDSTFGTGRRPNFIEPAQFVDTVPILIDRPSNNLTLLSEGLELTALLPEIPRIQTRIEVTGALVATDVSTSGLDFGGRFSDFQLTGSVQRSPYWEGVRRTGKRSLLTWRAIHHQPSIGLVVTAVIQQQLSDRREDVALTDTMAFAGYVTRTGEIVPIALERRGDPEFADVRRPRSGIPRGLARPDEWLMNIQVSKTLPREGRFSFYAYNALNRVGKYARTGSLSRLHAAIQFGMEVSYGLGPLMGNAR